MSVFPRYARAGRSPGVRHALAALLFLTCTDAVAAPLCPQSRDGPNREQLKYGVSPHSSLRARVVPPSTEAINSYVQSGVTTARAHRLTSAEWSKIGRALKELPALHRHFLREHLRHLSFVDVPAGAGNGLTALISDGDFPVFDLTLRAGILNETLSEFLTTKERMVFSDDGSGTTVSINAPGSALVYVLLHESTHVLDRALKLTMDLDPRFTAGIWLDRTHLDAPWNATAVASNAFRRSPKVPISAAPVLYGSLSASPFVSLYATAAAPEDFAELVAWRELALRSEHPLEIVVRDRSDEPVYRLEPLRGANIRARFAAVNALLSECRIGREGLTGASAAGS